MKSNFLLSIKDPQIEAKYIHKRNLEVTINSLVLAVLGLIMGCIWLPGYITEM
jgi:hypothetical protein